MVIFGKVRIGYTWTGLQACYSGTREEENSKWSFFGIAATVTVFLSASMSIIPCAV